MRGELRRIGVLGGTFDPPHAGHVVAAVNARHALGLDAVYVVPANRPWQKAGTRGVSPPEDRLALVRLACGDLDQVEVSSIEIDRGGDSYTIDTVEALRRRLPDATVFVIVGSDIAPQLGTWHRAEDLRTTCTIVVYDRPGSTGHLPPPGWTFERLSMPQLDIASTDIRARCADGRPIDGLVPPAVGQYIREHRLYASSDSGSPR